MRALSLSLFMIVALGPLGVALACTLVPLPTGPVAAVFPPWWGARQAVAAAGSAGAVIRLGALPSVVIVLAADRGLLRSHGAWLLLDPSALGGCSPSAS